MVEACWIRDRATRLCVSAPPYKDRTRINFLLQGQAKMPQRSYELLQLVTALGANLCAGTGSAARGLLLDRRRWDKRVSQLCLPCLPRQCKMRALARSLRHLRRLTKHHADGGHTSVNRVIRQKNAVILCSSTSRSLNSLSTILRRNDEASRFMSPGVEILRNMFSTVAADSIKDVPQSGPMAEYDKRIASGELVDGDSFQVDTIQQLQRLYEDLVENEEACQLDRYQSCEKSRSSRWLWSCLMAPPTSHAPVKGLYLYGGVGTGKTMLMDLFYEQLPANWRKKRIHFHDFMLNVHSRLQMHKGVSDPLDMVAAEISDEAIILCLDEFMVTDVADAMLLNRLFKHLFSKGVILVSTSNRPPDQLYEGGLQRNLFLPFTATLKDRCIAHPIGSAVDYRQLGSAEEGFYFVGD